MPEELSITIVIVVLVLVAVLIGVDIWLMVDHITGNTWSEMIREAGKVTTFVPWVLAILVGRWFHPVPDFGPLAGGISVGILMILSYIIVVTGDILRKKRKPIPSWLTVLIGLISGALFVPAIFPS